MKVTLLTMCVLACVVFARCADILAVLPFPAKPHHAVIRPLLIQLTKRGHRVTYVTPLPLKMPPANMTQVAVDDVMNKVRHTMASEGDESRWINEWKKWLMGKWFNLLVMEVGTRATELFLQDPNMKALIHDTTTKYDLILLETTFAQESLAALSHKYDAPIVEIMPTNNFHWTYFVHGNPYDTGYIVEAGTQFSDHMTFFERLMNTAVSMASRFYNMYHHMPKAEALADTYIRYPGWNSRPPLIDMVRNTSLILVNSHLALNYPYPLSPNFKEIGGIHLQNKPKRLPKELQEFMDGANDGVIYFSMGSHIPVPTAIQETLTNEFLKVFSKIKQRIVWRWVKDIDKVSDNVKVSKWFPQQDILAHKSVKLFITHGGVLSITESVYNGVPIIGIPIMGDQHKNLNQIKAAGCGVSLEINNVTEAAISWAINEILSNPRYSQIAKERQAIFKDQKRTPIETAIYWIEYVLRHDGAHHLSPSVASLVWCQQALLDVYITLAAAIIVLFMIFYFLLKAISRITCCRKTSAEKKEEEKPKKKRKKKQ